MQIREAGDGILILGIQKFKNGYGVTGERIRPTDFSFMKISTTTTAATVLHKLFRRGPATKKEQIPLPTK